MKKFWVAAIAAMVLSACNGTDGGGGGAVDERRLPDSNNVNPSKRPDTYIDPKLERKHEAKDEQVQDAQ